MDGFIIARAIHILAVVMWIGGVAFVTAVLMPSIRSSHPPYGRLDAFHRVEAGRRPHGVAGQKGGSDAPRLH